MRPPSNIRIIQKWPGFYTLEECPASQQSKPKVLALACQQAVLHSLLRRSHSPTRWTLAVLASVTWTQQYGAAKPV